MTLRRPRKAVVLIAMVTTLAVLCCAGSVTLILFGGLDQDDKQQPNMNAAAFGCGKAGPIDANAKLPTIKQYGADQVRNASIIINVGAKLKMPPRAWVIAVATAMQESRLVNLGNLGSRNDHDSLGLFQQRPSSGWGTPTQVRDPEYAATKFYEKLKKVGAGRGSRSPAQRKPCRSAPTRTRMPSTSRSPPKW